MARCQLVGLTGVYLPRLGQVGDAGVRAHEHVSGMQRAVEEATLALAEVDTAERRLWKVVGLNQGQAVDADLVDRVHCLEHPRHPLERLKRKSNRQDVSK